MGWKLVAYAAPVLIVVAGLVVLVTADGPAPEAANSFTGRGYPEDVVGATRERIQRFPVEVRCAAIGRSPENASTSTCRLRQQAAFASACADPRVETVWVVVFLIGPGGQTVNAVSDILSCPVGALLVT